MNETRSDALAWVAETARSARAWRSDPIAESRGEWLFYKGGAETGTYIWISADGTTEVGTYWGAAPSIGDALFQPRGSFQPAEDANSSLSVVLERMGREFLLDFVAPGLPCSP